MSKNELSVRLSEKPVGTLYRSGPNMRFAYSPTAKKALSMSMPLGKDNYGNRYCEAFFGGLLPESTKAKVIIGRLFGVNPNNSFNLLSAIGYDCAGAVSLCNPNDAINASDVYKLQGESLTEDKLSLYLQDLPRRPLLAHLKEIRISLAGAQDKAALCMIENNLCLPQGDSPSTHILKPPIADLADSVHNEFFCMRLASAIGLSVAKVQIRSAKKMTYLLIERYDRKLVGTNKIRRIHQEDFCQASGIVSTSKYQIDGGPSMKQCFDLLYNSTSPAASRKQLLDLVIFNYLIGNADAHGKNFSFMYPDDGTIEFTPAYDLLSTRVYKQTTDKLAMAIGKEYQIEAIGKRHWQKFCQDNILSYSGFKQRCAEVIEMLSGAVATEAQELKESGFASPIIKKIAAYIDQSCKNLSKELGV